MSRTAVSNPTDSPASILSLDEAFAACKQLAVKRDENFLIGSFLVKRVLRPHFYSIYAFCRGVDDLGDESLGERMSELKVWEEHLQRCYTGKPHHPWFIALQNTIQSFDIPREPFHKLIEANRQDQRVNRYSDFDSLLEYCDLSANPVGHLMLYLFGHDDAEMMRLADQVCTGLQLANFWQDVVRDYAKGRIYLPKSDMKRFGVSENDIAERKLTPQFREMMKFQVERTRGFFRRGYPLVHMLNRDARTEAAMFISGGLSILDVIEKNQWDVISHRPTLSKSAKITMLVAVYLRFLFGREPLPNRRFYGLENR